MSSSSSARSSNVNVVGILQDDNVEEVRINDCVAFFLSVSFYFGSFVISQYQLLGKHIIRKINPSLCNHIDLLATELEPAIPALHISNAQKQDEILV